MDTVTILRELWRRRRAVIVVVVLAVLVATSVIYQLPSLKSRRYTVGLATTQILVDTPTSQVADVAPHGADSLGLRANLLASLMVDGAVKSDIARKAGLRPDHLGGTTSASSTSSAAGGGASSPPASQPSGPEAHVLNTNILSDPTGEQLPIIQVQVQAPDAAGAARLANAAISGLREYLDSTAAEDNIPDSQRLHVDPLGVPQPALAGRGPSMLLAILAFVGVLAIGCGAVLAFPRLVRRWRAAAEEEAQAAPEPQNAADGSDAGAAARDEADKVASPPDDDRRPPHPDTADHRATPSGLAGGHGALVAVPSDGAGDSLEARPSVAHLGPQPRRVHGRLLRSPGRK